MADFLDESGQSGKIKTFVPPPPSDVSIRTMASDVESMALSGGSFPQAERISLPRSQSKVSTTGDSGAGGLSRGSGSFLWTLLFLVGGVAILGALFYFVYPFLFGEKLGGGGGAPTPTSTVNGGLPPVSPRLTIPRFEHRSSFRTSPNESRTLVVDESARSVSDLKTYDQKLNDLLSSIEATSSLIEIGVRKNNDQHLALSEFFSLINSKVFDGEFLAKNFDHDFTFFVYKNRDGFWPGFVTKLRPDKSWVLLKLEISKMEKSPDLSSLFITDPGAPSGDFKDTLVINQPARSLKFGAPSANLIYGWFHDYLVISTSEAGLKEVIRKL